MIEGVLRWRIWHAMRFKHMSMKSGFPVQNVQKGSSRERNWKPTSEVSTPKKSHMSAGFTFSFCFTIFRNTPSFYSPGTCVEWEWAKEEILGSMRWISTQLFGMAHVKKKLFYWLGAFDPIMCNAAFFKKKNVFYSISQNIPLPI